MSSETEPAGEADVNSALGKLESVLSEQLQLLSRHSLDGMEHLCDRADQLLRKVSENVAMIDADACKHLESIYVLHKRVSLAAAQKNRELADQLGKISKGKGALRAYGRSTDTQNG